MSLQNALQFMGQIRKDETVKSQIEVLATQADLESLVELGAEAGFSFTVSELRAAFKEEWVMRWFHYGSRAIAPAQSASVLSKTHGKAS